MKEKTRNLVVTLLVFASAAIAALVILSKALRLLLAN
jgi:hypothetical protein